MKNRTPEHVKGVDDCAARFVEVAAARGYRRAVRTVREEFPREVVEDFEAQGRSKPPAVSEHATTRHHANPESIHAARRWQSLHDNTA